MATGCPLKVKQNQRFPKRCRLQRRGEFLRIYNEGKRIASRHLVLHYLEGDPHKGPRIGITVTRKCGKAVRRNRWKRLIREVYRLHRSQIPTIDFVVTVKRGVEIPPFQVLEKELIGLWRRIARDLNPPGSER